jgi:hypothetical protein
MPLFAFHVEAQVWQAVRSLETNQRMAGMTWQNGITASVGADNLERAVREDVDDLLTVLVNDYLAANPK